jgi:hypothetical protein
LSSSSAFGSATGPSLQAEGAGPGRRRTAFRPTGLMSSLRRVRTVYYATWALIVFGIALYAVVGATHN